MQEQVDAPLVQVPGGLRRRRGQRGNDARWINHGCAPNCEARENDAGTRVAIYALRDIPSNEELLYDYGGGSATGRPIRAVQVGGPLGAYLPESQFDTPLDYEAFAALGAVLGHGGIVVFDDTVDMADMARYAMEFCAIESCGKCTPCRIGSTRGEELLEQIIVARSEGPQPGRIELLKSLCDTMLGASLCALGGMTPYPVLSALNHFPEDFGVSKDAAEAR